MQKRVPAILPLLRLGFAKHGKLYNLHSLLSIIMTKKKERVVHLLLLLLFMIDLINAYMANAIYLYVIVTLMSIQATLVFEELTFLFSILLALLLLLLTCFMFAQANVNIFCDDSNTLRAMSNAVLV